MTILIAGVALVGMLYGLYCFKRLVDKTPDPSREEIAEIIRTFFDGKGGEYDWDDFLTFPLKDSTLDAIRVECENVRTQHPPDKKGMWCNDAGLAKLKAIEERLRRSD